ncbi:hypothetical protein WMY93_033518 [Mugilogobius chulae]|uniref:Uncharacterized protein n=1 Tax=Mugilogobius chulae TaxID=88201 RepID=A0AAW0MKI4_9GOBI
MAMPRPVCTSAFSIESLISGPGPGPGSGSNSAPLVYSYPMFVPYRSVLLPPPLPPPHGYGMTLTSAIFPPQQQHGHDATRKFGGHDAEEAGRRGLSRPESRRRGRSARRRGLCRAPQALASGPERSMVDYHF